MKTYRINCLVGFGEHNLRDYNVTRWSKLFYRVENILDMIRVMSQILCIILKLTGICMWCRRLIKVGTERDK